MERHKEGTFSYTLVGSNIEGHNHFKESWVMYQLVATNFDGEGIGSTSVFPNSIALSPCM